MSLTEAKSDEDEVGAAQGNSSKVWECADLGYWLYGPWARTWSSGWA